MRTFIKKSAPIIAAVAITGAFATTAPAMAHSMFDAQNANKVDGYHAADLGKLAYGQNSTFVDNFDGCSFQNLYTRNIAVPVAGYLAVWGNVGAARDTDFPDEGLLTTRLVIDGNVISEPSSVNLENDGVQDANSTTAGLGHVGKGQHVVTIQAEECGAGEAFIVSRSMTSSFSPFGNIVAPAVAPAAKSINR